MHWPRKRHRAQQFQAGEDVFHDYHWPNRDAADSTPASGPGGRPRFNWTPKRSRELIRLIIHTDIRFDDIAAAMKDESGNGPSESTCRDHWHEIFGYTPDVARLKNPEGRSRRLKEHEKAFKAYCNWVQLRSRSSSIRLEKDADLDDSFEVPPEVDAEPLDVQKREPDLLQHVRSRLNPVQQLKKTISHQEPVLSSLRSNAQSDGLSPITDQITPKCPDDVEKKYGLPQGFIPWIKGASISSTESIRRISLNTVHSMRRLSSRVRIDSVANVTSHPHCRQSSTVIGDTLLSNYLSSFKPEDDVPVGEVDSLIRGGADVNGPNERGETPLHLAVALGSIVVVTLLLEKGADPTKETLAGETVWARGRKASIAAIDPNADDDYERRRAEIQRMICARIEFARTTVKYNPTLITEQKPIKRPRHGGGSVGPTSAPTSSAFSTSSRSRPRVPRNIMRPSPSDSPSWQTSENSEDSTPPDSEAPSGSSASPFASETKSLSATSETGGDMLPPSLSVSSHHDSMTSNELTLPTTPNLTLYSTFPTYVQSNPSIVSQNSMQSPHMSDPSIDTFKYNAAPTSNPDMTNLTESFKDVPYSASSAELYSHSSMHPPNGQSFTPQMSYTPPVYYSGPDFESAAVPQLLPAQSMPPTSTSPQSPLCGEPLVEIPLESQDISEYPLGYLATNGGGFSFDTLPTQPESEVTNSNLQYADYLAHTGLEHGNADVYYGHSTNQSYA